MKAIIRKKKKAKGIVCRKIKGKEPTAAEGRFMARWEARNKEIK
jgi:hypothetical protein